MIFRIIMFALLIMLTALSYGKNFYLVMNNGILSVITTNDIPIDNAITLGFNTITFNEQILLQFASSESLSPSENFLAEQLFHLLNNSENYNNIIFESGSTLEEEFFTLPLGFVTNEFYQQNQEVIIYAEAASNEHVTQLTGLLNSYSDLTSPTVTDYPCMFGCNAYLSHSRHRTDHHKSKKHRTQYEMLKYKCDNGFKCQFCGLQINSIQVLGCHLHKCPMSKNYLDFLN